MRTITFVGVNRLALVAVACGLSGCGSDPKDPAPKSQPTAEAGVAVPDAGNSAPKPPLAPADEFPIPAVAGLAPTPPMGWNSWNKFGCEGITAELIEETADAMVESGMRDVGYQYINIDDCWLEAERDEDGRPQPTDGFPDGIAPVADYVHSLGLKLGLYSDRGETTCGRRVGARGHEVADAKLYAEWGVDYLKFDNCDYIDGGSEHNLDPELVQSEFTQMAAALKDSGRDIVFSICAWNFYEWSVGMGQLWRTTSDIKPQWDKIMAMVGTNAPLAAYAGPNGWNDPDMLEVGVGGLTGNEERAHLGLWAMMASPLIAGNDLRDMGDQDRTDLTNAEVIAVDQDTWGIQGVAVRTQKNDDGTTLAVWARPLNEAGARAVLLLNNTETTADISFTLEEIGLRSTHATARDLWNHEDLAEIAGSLTLSVPYHGSVMLKVVGEDPEIPVGTVAVSDLQWMYAANALGPVERDSYVGATAAQDGDPISLGGEPFERGLGVGAASAIIYRLAENCNRFTAVVGIDDNTDGKGSVVFRVEADGESLFESDVLTGESGAAEVDVDLTGKRHLKLLVTNGGDGNSWDRASWGNPTLLCKE